MTPEAYAQIGLFVLEVIVVGGLLLGLYQLRRYVGIAPLCVTLGGLQHLQTLLASAVYIEVIPGIWISPGSSVLFTATLVTGLVVYIRDDAARAQSLIFGIVAANFIIALISVMANFHVSSPLAALSQGLSPGLLTENLQPLIIGTCLLGVDIVLIIVIYEYLYRLFPGSLLLRVGIATCLVVSFDTLVFVTALFYGQESYTAILQAGLLGKNVAGFLYAILVTFALRWSFADETPLKRSGGEIDRVLNILTYRQRYERLKSELALEPMTGLFNRRFFDENLPTECERATRLNHHLILMLIDLDHFKQINDNHGHPVGDQVIRATAAALRKAFRAADICCRYGGEEFAVIMPESTVRSALRIAESFRGELQAACRSAGLPFEVEKVTFTAGIASYPHDASSADELLRVADHRLYLGKEAGRDQVMIGEAKLTESQLLIID